jgi:hypothetical protein
LWNSENTGTAKSNLDRDDAMTNLAGKLIASPSPNRPGSWAYRLLEDGRVLETELTKEEMIALRDAAMAEMNQRIDEINAGHPLNVAAMDLIRRANEYPGNPGSMHWLHILSLASLGLADYDGNSEAREQLAYWTTGEETMTKALRCLENAEMDPEQLLTLSPIEAARLILDELGIG